MLICNRLTAYSTNSGPAYASAACDASALKCMRCRDGGEGSDAPPEAARIAAPSTYEQQDTLRQLGSLFVVNPTLP